MNFTGLGTVSGEVGAFFSAVCVGDLIAITLRLNEYSWEVMPPKPEREIGAVELVAGEDVPWPPLGTAWNHLMVTSPLPWILDQTALTKLGVER